MYVRNFLSTTKTHMDKQNGIPATAARRVMQSFCSVNLYIYKRKGLVQQSLFLRLLYDIDLHGVCCEKSVLR